MARQATDPSLVDSPPRRRRKYRRRRSAPRVARVTAPPSPAPAPLGPVDPVAREQVATRAAAEAASFGSPPGSDGPSPVGVPPAGGGPAVPAAPIVTTAQVATMVESVLGL